MNKLKNFFLCIKYPFLKLRNVWSGKFLGYKYTWYDEIPEGWQKAFGKQLIKDLKIAIKKDKCQKSFRFEQIKEKWGQLCLYASGFGKESEKVLSYYEAISAAYCINCGKPVRYITDGWIEYYCEDCFLNYLKRVKANCSEEQLNEIIKKCRVTKADITIHNCIDSEFQKMYDSINWESLWDLDHN